MGSLWDLSRGGFRDSLTQVGVFQKSRSAHESVVALQKKTEVLWGWMSEFSFNTFWLFPPAISDAWVKSFTATNKH